jgi:hypothetical protein
MTTHFFFFSGRLLNNIALLFSFLKKPKSRSFFLFIIYFSVGMMFVVVVVWLSMPQIPLLRDVCIQERLKSHTLVRFIQALHRIASHLIRL